MMLNRIAVLLSVGLLIAVLVAMFRSETITCYILGVMSFIGAACIWRMK